MVAARVFRFCTLLFAITAVELASVHYPGALQYDHGGTQYYQQPGLAQKLPNTYTQAISSPGLNQIYAGQPAYAGQQAYVGQQPYAGQQSYTGHAQPLGLNVDGFTAQHAALAAQQASAQQGLAGQQALAVQQGLAGQQAYAQPQGIDIGAFAGQQGYAAQQAYAQPQQLNTEAYFGQGQIIPQLPQAVGFAPNLQLNVNQLAAQGYNEPQVFNPTPTFSPLQAAPEPYKNPLLNPSNILQGGQEGFFESNQNQNVVQIGQGGKNGGSGISSGVLDAHNQGGFDGNKLGGLADSQQGGFDGNKQGGFGGGFDGSQQGGFGGNKQNSLGGKQQGGLDGNQQGGFDGNNQGGFGGKGQGGQEGPIVTKDIYIHSAPDDIEEEAELEKLKLGPIRKHYRVIFIKAPSQSTRATALKLIQAQNEEQTVIYVLSKHSDAAEIHSEIKSLPSHVSKPEVFFIKYKTPEEAQLAQQQIQEQFDALGGTTRISDEGLSPITSVIGALDNLDGNDFGGLQQDKNGDQLDGQLLNKHSNSGAEGQPDSSAFKQGYLAPKQKLHH